MNTFYGKIAVRDISYWLILIFSLIIILLFLDCSQKKDPIEPLLLELDQCKNILFDRSVELKCCQTIYILSACKNDKRVIQAINNVLNESSSFIIKSSAAHALGVLKDTSSVLLLCKTLNRTPDISVMVSSAWALGEICDVRSIEPLLQTFIVKKVTLEQLHDNASEFDMPGSSTARDQIQYLINNYYKVRNAIEAALIKIDNTHNTFPLSDIYLIPSDEYSKMIKLPYDKKYVPKTLSAPNSIIELLYDPWSFHEATRLLGTIRAIEAVPHLIDLINKNRDDVPYIIIRSLGEIGDSKAVNTLIKLKSNDNIKDVIPEALGKICDKRAIPYLQGLLKNGDHNVRYKSAEALVKIDEDRFLTLFLQLLKDKSPVYPPGRQIRDNVALFLVQFDDPQVIEKLSDALISDHEFETGAKVLSKIDKEKMYEIITNELLNDKNNYVVEYAINILAEMKEKRSIPYLIEILNNLDNSESIRVSAAFSLGEIGDKSAIPDLIKTSKDTTSSWLPRTAKEAIEKLETGE